MTPTTIDFRPLAINWGEGLALDLTKMLNKTTLGDLADNGSTSGFDYLRIILSTSVLAWHSNGIVNGRDFSIHIAGSYLGNFVLLILPAFFALSGFLVTSSLMRSKTLAEFMGLRLLRLIPALAVEIFLSALLLGPLLTSFNLTSYFSDTKFASYFLNIFGLVHYQLPGLFQSNPIPSVVNGSLWTIPYELECYIALGLLWLLRLRTSGYAALVLLLIWCGAFAALALAGRYEPIGADTVNGRLLVAYFLAGVILYHFRHRILADWRLFLVAIILAPIMIKSKVAIFLSPVVIAYLTVYIGLLRPAKIPFIFTGDYSYGIYLYAFPVQQSVYQLVPASHSWLAHLVLSLFFTSCLAAFSWHMIEKPILRLKQYLRRKPLGETSQWASDLSSATTVWTKHFAWFPVKAHNVRSDDEDAYTTASYDKLPSSSWFWLTTLETRRSSGFTEFRRPVRQLTNDEYDARQY